MSILIGGRYSADEKALYSKLLDKYQIHFIAERPGTKILKNVKVVVMPSWRELEPLVPQMPALRLVQGFFAGVDRIDFKDIPGNVKVATASGATSSYVAEHAFAMLLALTRNLVFHQEALKKGIFSQTDPLNLELKGKRIGILGYGAIGKTLGRIAKAFEMEVHALNRSGVSDADKTYSMDGLLELLKQVDYIVISLSMNKDTIGLIKAQELSAMKNDAILINVSRGAIINESDLYHHLLNNPCFKAGIDVWWHYPNKNEKWKQDYPFEELENVIMTPHNAALVRSWRMRTIEFCCENVKNFLEQKKVKNIIDKKDYLI